MTFWEWLKQAKKIRFKTRSKVQPLSASLQSRTGINVTEELANKVSAYWACTNLLSDLVASLPLHLYRRTVIGREVAKDNALYRLLHASPNADMTAYEFKNYMVKSMCTAGNFYGLKEYIKDELIAVTPLVPDKVTPYFEGIDKYFDYQNPLTGLKETYTDEDILHVPCFGYNGLRGFSPLSNMRDSIGIALASNELSADSFRNADQFGGAIIYERPLKREQKEELRESVAINRSDPLRNMLILDGAPKLESFRISPADLQMIESQQFSVEDICRWFRVPPHMVGHSNVTTWGSGIEEQTLGFLTFTLHPSYLSRIEQAFNMRLLSPAMREEYYFEFKTEALLRANLGAQTQHFATMLQNGVYNRNEVREKYNLPPIEGGDEYTVQVNMTLLDMLGRMANGNEGA